MATTEEFKIIRDERGRIVTRTGAPPNGGRPRLDDAEKIRAAVRGMLDDETLIAWQAAMKKKLAKGNSFAAEYVRDTLVGKPAVTANVNVSGELSAFMAAWQSLQPGPAADAPIEIADSSVMSSENDLP